MIAGTKVQLRTKEYVVPSLSLEEVETFQANGVLEKVPANGMTMLAMKESREAAVVVLLASLRWNYPEITREEVARELDLGNCEAAMQAVMGASRLLGGGSGEAVP